MIIESVQIENQNMYSIIQLDNHCTLKIELRIKIIGGWKSIQLVNYLRLERSYNTDTYLYQFIKKMSPNEAVRLKASFSEQVKLEMGIEITSIIHFDRNLTIMLTTNLINKEDVRPLRKKLVDAFAALENLVHVETTPYKIPNNPYADIDENIKEGTVKFPSILDIMKIRDK